MNPIFKQRDRVSLPSGKKGLVRRVQKSGFLDIKVDDGSDVVIHPTHVTKIAQASPRAPSEVDLLQEQLVIVNENIREANQLLVPFRAELKQLRDKMKPMQRELKLLMKRKKEVVSSLRRTVVRRAERIAWHAQQSAT